MLDEGIEKEQDEEKKQKLTEKKDKMLTTVETKVKSFNFWGEVKQPQIVVNEDTSLPSAYDPFDFSLKDDGSFVRDNILPFMQQSSPKGGSPIK